MPWLTVWRWVVVRLLGNPWIGVAAFLLLGILPLNQALRPLPSPTGAIEVAASWAFPAALVGALVTLPALARGAGLLARLGPRDRFAAESGALVLGGAFLQLPILGGLLLAGVAPSALGSLPVAILSTVLHLAGVALLVLQLQLPSAFGASLLFALVWLLAPLAPALVWVDAGAALRAPVGSGIASSFAAAGALLLAGYLCRTGIRRASGG